MYKDKFTFYGVFFLLFFPYRHSHLTNKQMSSKCLQERTTVQAWSFCWLIHES